MKNIEVVKIRNIVEQVIDAPDIGWMHNTKTKEGRKLKFDVHNKDFKEIENYANNIHQLLVANDINVLSVSCIAANNLKRFNRDNNIHNIIVLLDTVSAKNINSYTLTEIIKLTKHSEEVTAVIRTIVQELEKKLK